MKSKVRNLWSALAVWYRLLTSVVNNDLQG